MTSAEDPGLVHVVWHDDTDLHVIVTWLGVAVATFHTAAEAKTVADNINALILRERKEAGEVMRERCAALADTQSGLDLSHAIALKSVNDFPGERFYRVCSTTAAMVAKDIRALPTAALSAPCSGDE